MQAVTNNLENLILKGKASYNVYNFSMGMFGAIPITPGNTAIITNITFFPFLNPIKDLSRDMLANFTYRDLLSYIEYTLKIDGKKSKNYHVFRNELNVTFLQNGASITLDSIINPTLIQDHFLFGTKSPIQIPTYQICEEFIKLTVSRNALVDRLINTNDNVNATANEENTPEGVQDLKVLVKTGMIDEALNRMDYFPPSINNSGELITINRSNENYSQDFYGVSGTSFNGQLTPPQDMSGTNTALLRVNPYGSTPLIQLGYVLINKNAFDELINN
jgi:hypothetical protein